MTAPSPADERAAFEAWYRDEYPSDMTDTWPGKWTLARDKDGNYQHRKIVQGWNEWQAAAAWARAPSAPAPASGGGPFTDIVFAAQPALTGPDDMIFVEVEDHTGRSFKLGEWVKRPDGYWALRFTPAPVPSGGGWVSVPREPTPEMQEAAEISDREYTLRVFGKMATVRQGPWDTYVTMIAAAPTPAAVVDAKGAAAQIVAEMLHGIEITVGKTFTTDTGQLVKTVADVIRKHITTHTPGASPGLTETVMEPLTIDDDLATWLSGYANGEMSRIRINVYTFEHLMAASRKLRLTEGERALYERCAARYPACSTADVGDLLAIISRITGTQP